MSPRLAAALLALSAAPAVANDWAAGQSMEAAPVLGPGGYWFQPGGQPHADACLSAQSW